MESDKALEYFRKSKEFNVPTHDQRRWGDFRNDYSPLWNLLPAGPWDDDIKHNPSEKTYVHAKTGYICHIRRNLRHATWNGYVYLPKGHPSCDEDIEVYPQVDGFDRDLTYYDKEDCCYGFDLCGYRDLIPSMDISYLQFVEDDTYKDIEFVMELCSKLAFALKNVEFQTYSEWTDPDYSFFKLPKCVRDK